MYLNNQEIRIMIIPKKLKNFNDHSFRENKLDSNSKKDKSTKKTRPNILFIHMPSIPVSEIEARIRRENQLAILLAMPMGILYLSSYIKNNCDINKVGILDYVLHLDEIEQYKTIDNFIEEIAKKDIDFYPDILAFSLQFTVSYGFFEKCINKLKKIWPKSIVIVGGNHATNSTKFLLADKNVDFVLRGEGEISFSLFVTQFSNNEEIHVNGIYNKENAVDENPLKISDMVENLDSIPFPDWVLIDMKSYSHGGTRRHIAEEGTREYLASAIITTRGCPFHCTYCSSHNVHGRRMRYRSIRNVVEEIKQLNLRYGINLITPEDDIFTINKKWTLELLDEFKKIDIANFKMQFPNGLHINSIDEELMDAMINAGMNVANLAIESGCEYTQKNILKKNVNLEKARKVISYLRKQKDIWVRCYFILGLPHETKEQMIETIQYAKSLNADWCSFLNATPLPGSEIQKEFIKMGCVTDDPYWWSKAHYFERSFNIPEMSAEEQIEFTYRANLVCNFIENSNIINRNYEKAIEQFNDILILYPFHIVAMYSIFRCYSMMNSPELAEKARLKNIEMINSDVRSKEMYAKYKDLMPELKI